MNHRRTIVQTGHPEWDDSPWFQVEGICADLLYQWRDTHVNHPKKYVNGSRSLLFQKTPFFIFKFWCRACVFWHRANHKQSLFVYPNQFSKTYSTVHGWVDRSLSSEMLRRSFSKQFQPTAEIKHNNSPVTSHLLQQLIDNHNFCSESHHNSPHLPAIFLVKLQGPPNLKPDITICVWLQQE